MSPSAAFHRISLADLARELRLEPVKPAKPAPPAPKREERARRVYPDAIVHDWAPGYWDGQPGTTYVRGVGRVERSVYASLNFSPLADPIAEQLRRLGYGETEAAS